MDHFGVELDSVELPLGRGDGGDGARCGAAGDAEAGGQRRDGVAMVHPDLLRAGEAGKQGVGALFDFERGQTVLAFVALAHRAAEQVRHELLAVADTQDRAAERENGGIDGGAGGIVNAARAAGDDDALGVREFGGGSFAGADFGVDAQFADLAGDEVTVLSAGVEDDNLRWRVQIRW